MNDLQFGPQFKIMNVEMSLFSSPQSPCTRDSNLYSSTACIKTPRTVMDWLFVLGFKATIYQEESLRV
jgi:hypothetical protein